MAVRQRYQNPIVGSTIRLRLLHYNSNLLENINSVNEVKIYRLDPEEVSASNPDGRYLLETIDAGSVVNEDEGMYYIDLATSSPTYTIGDYLDVWSLKIDSSDMPESLIENKFTIYPELSYTTTIPIVYDFDFRFEPNRITKGSKKWLRIQIIPQVPTATALERYYTNLAISSTLKINIAKKCDPCLPQESDLRIILEDEQVEQREKVFGYYHLDTEEMDCGLYDIWFKLEHGDNVFVSDKNQLLVY